MADEHQTVDLVAIGEPLVAFVVVDRGRSLTEAEQYSTHVVGAELNMAVGLARLGHRVSFAGIVGCDPFGEAIRRALRREGVDTKHVVVSELPTGLLFRDLRETPPPSVLYRRSGSAGAALTTDHVRSALAGLPPGTFVHLSGITPALSPDAREASMSLVECCKNDDLRLSLDLNYRALLWDKADATKVLRTLAEAAEFLFATDQEAALITGTDDLEESLRILSSVGPSLVALRRGVDAMAMERGASDPIRVSAHAVGSVIDPVGAGDAFAAGFLSGILDGLPLEEVLLRAHDCGRAVVGSVGDTTGALTRSELARARLREVVR